MSTEKTGAEAQAGSISTLLTSAEIEAIIPILKLGGEPGDLSGDKSLDAFWLAVAKDPAWKIASLWPWPYSRCSASKSVDNLLGGRSLVTSMSFRAPCRRAGHSTCIHRAKDC